MLENKQEEFIKSIILDSCNPNKHLSYSKFLHKKGRDFLAFAEYKTAKYLGANKDIEYETQLKEKIPDLLELDYNGYFRLKSLANKLYSLKTDEQNISILDIGGGDGILSSFLNDTFKYCLAEPQSNGLDGTNLPFTENSFDYVVASHVFEHIPQKDRELFLNNMLKTASKGIILINPFYIEGTFVEARLELALEITKQKWVKEHLDCGLPKIEVVKEFANKYNKNIEITPNGSLTTAMTYVYLNHYSNASGKRQEYKKINKFYNQNYFNISTNEKYPVEYIVYIN